MTVEISSNYKYQYIETKLSGHVKGFELASAYRKLLGTNICEKYHGELIDMSQLIKPDISYNELHFYTHFMNEYFDSHNITKFNKAIYAPSDITFGIARMVQAMTNQHRVQVVVFRDLTQAKKWLISKLESDFVYLSA